MANDARLEEPMSDARLREIRKGIEFNQMGLDEDEALWAIGDLLAEVERLRAREAALLAVAAFAQAVASDHQHKWREEHRCKHCGIEFSTWAADIQRQARALLAAE